MIIRLGAVAALATALGVVAPAAADCGWDIGMAELDLMGIERAAPLIGDPALPLGPGGPDRISGSDQDLAERSQLAFGAWDGAQEGADDRLVIVEANLDWARDRLATARQQLNLGDQAACADALDQARQAIGNARAAFR